MEKKFKAFGIDSILGCMILAAAWFAILLGMLVSKDGPAVKIIQILFISSMLFVYLNRVFCRVIITKDQLNYISIYKKISVNISDIESMVIGNRIRNDRTLHITCEAQSLSFSFNHKGLLEELEILQKTISTENL